MMALDFARVKATLDINLIGKMQPLLKSTAMMRDYRLYRQYLRLITLLISAAVYSQAFLATCVRGRWTGSVISTTSQQKSSIAVSLNNREYNEKALLSVPSNNFKSNFLELKTVCKDGTLNDRYVRALKNVAACYPFLDGSRIPHIQHLLWPYIGLYQNHLICSNLDGQQVSDLLWSYSRLEYDVKEHKTLCSEAFGAFLKTNHHSIRSFAQGLHAASHMGLSLESKRGNVDQLPHTAVSSNGGTEEVSTFSNFRLSQIIHHLHKLLDNGISARELSSIVYSLGSMGLSAKDLPRDLSMLLVERLGSLVNDMISQGLANVLYGFGQMGMIYSAFPLGVKLRVENKLLGSLNNMTTQGFANAIYGLGHMNASYKNLHVSLQSSLLRAQVEKMPNMTVIGLGCSFYGLADLGVKWSDWGDESLDQIEDALSKHLLTINARALGTVCYTMGKMESNWYHLRSETRLLTLQALVKQMSSMTTQGLSNCLYGLALSNFPFSPSQENEQERKVHKQWQQGMQNAIVRQVKEMETLELCNVLYALGKMNYTWHYLDMDSGHSFALMEEALLEELEERASSLSPILLSMTLFSFSRLHLHYKDLSPTLLTKLQERVQEKLPLLEEQAAANCFIGFAGIKLTYSLLSPPLQEAIQTYLIEQIFGNSSQSASFSSDGVTGILYSLALMGVPWRPTQPPLPSPTTSLPVTLQNLNEKGVANTLYSLALMDATWPSIPQDIQLSLCAALSRTCHSMIAQEVANTMYALSLLSFDCDYSLSYTLLSSPQISLNHSTKALKAKFESTMLLYFAHSKVLEAFKRHIKLSNYYSTSLSPSTPLCDKNKYENLTISNDPQHLSQFAIYFQTMSCYETTHDLVKEILGEVPKVYAQSDITISALHQSFYAYLSNALPSDSYVLVNEYQGLGGIYPMDIAIFDKTNPFDTSHNNPPFAFIEVDGLSHYSYGTNKGFPSLCRSDRLKEFLYRKKFGARLPIFRVTVGMIKRKGLEETAQDIAQKVMRKQRKMLMENSGVIVGEQFY